MKKAVSIVSNVLLALLILCTAAVGIPKLFQVKILTVLSGSMEPALRPGDVVYVVPTKNADIKPGDVVSFVLDKNLAVATHRVVSKDDENKRLITKGDANKDKDGPVSYSNVLGVVRFSVPKVGYVFHFFATTAGKIIGFTVLISIILILLLLSGLKPKTTPPTKTPPLPQTTEVK